MLARYQDVERGMCEREFQAFKACVQVRIVPLRWTLFSRTSTESLPDNLADCHGPQVVGEQGGQRKFQSSSFPS
jgi:hypothetical protein